MTGAALKISPFSSTNWTEPRQATRQGKQATRAGNLPRPFLYPRIPAKIRPSSPSPPSPFPPCPNPLALAHTADFAPSPSIRGNPPPDKPHTGRGIRTGGNGRTDGRQADEGLHPPAFQAPAATLQSPRRNKIQLFSVPPLQGKRGFDTLYAVAQTRAINKDKDKERTKEMKTKIIDALAEAVGNLLEAALLALPLTVVVVGGSVLVGILHLCR